MKIKTLMLSALVVAMLTACGQMDTYTETVTATGDTITGRDAHGEAVTLTLCRTEDGGRLLLEDVEEGHRYRVRLDSFGTWSREDDAIIAVKEVRQ